MKRRRGLFCTAMALLALLLSPAGCSQPTDTSVPEDIVYRISLDREDYITYSPTGSEFEAPGPLEVTVTNTGNQLLEELAVVLSGIDKQQFSVSTDLIPSLPPGETASFTVSFPQEDPYAPVVYMADVLVGNSRAARKLPLTYGVFSLTAAVMDINPPLLQIDYEGHTSAAVSTADTDKGSENLWFSSNTSVAVIDGETGDLTISGAGETIIGFMVSENPLQVKGQLVTVYPPVGTLRPEYPLVAGLLSRPSGETAAPLNIAAIQAMAAAGDSLVFTKTGGGGVISAIDPDTGKLAFTGNDQSAADISVDLLIIKNVTEGELPIFQGRSTFNVQIGSAPAAVVLSAETINGPEDLWATQVKVTFSDFINAGIGDAKDGFTITKNENALTIVSAIIGGDTIIFTLDAQAAFGEALSISYNPSAGTISAGGTPAAGFNARTVTNKLADPAPWLVRAVVENASPNIVQVTFSEPVTLQDVSKFRVRANGMPRANIASDLSGDAPIMDYGSTARTVTAAVSAGGDDRTWNLTMSAAAAYGEILMLSTTDAGAAKDKAATPNELSRIPQFIIKNDIKRQKAAYEAEAGFYRNGVKIDAVDNGDGDDLYKNAISLLTTSGNYPQLNEILTIVLDSNQTYTGSDSFNSTHIPTSLIGGETRLIITTKTGNTQDYVITVTGNGAGIIARNGLNVIIDEHVIFDHGGASINNTNALIVVNDGGKVILDGGEIRNNKNAHTTERAGGVRMGGGSYGAHFILNSGKITGNQVEAGGNDSTSNHGGAGGVYIQQYGAFVMHGG
ncbi:MAG: hypothetical protein LBF77_08560, partial [Spirochaetaceae bacterium]|nr:hypothetical protein [Spirochaetaceae bacterium]